ncbi:MAG: S-layer protein [Candidatus Woesearchaeota archaeon]
MNVKKVMKKVVALGTGASMVGATLLGALAAADLSQYPSPLFVKDGKFDGIIVVGDSAAASDVVGSVDIATALQFASKTTVSGSGSGVTTTVEGDAFKIQKSGDNLNLGEQLSGAGSRGGPVSVIDKSGLDALADGSISNAKGTFTYNQYIDMPDSASVVYATDSDQSEDPALYLKFVDDSKVYTYRLSFPTALRTDVDSADDWKDLDNKKITLLGQEYTIIGTDNSTGTLTLMGGAIQDTLSEGESKTYTINGVDYEVEVTIITASDVLFKVNGEVTDKMQEATTFKLKDGTEIGVKTLLSQDFAGGSRIVEYYLGAQKVELVDPNFASGSSGTLSVGSDTVSGAMVDIVGSVSAAETRISKIEIQWNATDDYYVPVGGKLSQRLPSDEKGKLFLENIDFELAGVDFGSTEKIEIKPAADNKYKMTMPVKTGELSFYAMYSDASADCKLGKDDTHQIITAIATPIGQNDQFIVSSNRFSHLVEASSFDTSNYKVKFKDLGTGDSFEVSTVSGVGTMYLDGFAYNFKVDYNNKYVNITGNMGSDGAVLYTPKEAMIGFTVNTAATPDSCIVKLTEDANGQEDATTTVNYINVTVADAGTGSNQPLNIGSAPVSTSSYFSLQSWDSKNNFQTAYTKYGTNVEYNSDPDQDTVTIYYPSKEALASTYVTSGVTKIASSSSGASTSTTITPIQVGTAKLASEVRDIAAQNMIVVGGPCANAVAAQLMGNPADCTEGFTEGKAMIKLYEQGSKVALLVAGYSALDTRRACRVLANSGQYSLSGMEAEVSGTTLTDISVSKVG